MSLSQHPVDRPTALAGHVSFLLESWQVEPARLILSRDGTETRLEPRVMALLVALARAEGNVVARAELLDVAWSDVTVGDEALTMAVSKLRRALGKREDGGAFIETIPRIGYRLLVEARMDSTGEPTRTESQDPVEPISRESAATDPAPSVDQAVRRSFGLWALVAAFLVASVFWIHRVPEPVAPPPPEPLPLESRGLTALPGVESQAKLGPGGGRLSFQRIQKGQDGLLVLDLASNSTSTVVEGFVTAASWSPLDQRIVFISLVEGREVLSMVNANGGPVETLREVQASPLTGTDWSPDAQAVAWAGYSGTLRSFVIKELDLRSGQVRELTRPPAETLGDGRPAYSLDGRWLAFVRGDHLYSYDLWLLDRRTLETRRLTHDHRRVWGLDWFDDSRRMIFSSNREGPFRLWSLSIQGDAEPEWVPVTGDQVRFPNLQGSTLVYDVFEVKADLFELRPDGAMKALDRVASKARESAPAWSPDGRTLAFASDRSGTAEVWLRGENGGLRKISELGASLIHTISWAPDASKLAVLSILEGDPTVILVDLRTGESRTVSSVARNLFGVTFAPDGKRLFFTAPAGQGHELWQTGLEPDAVPTLYTDFGAFSLRFDRQGTAYALDLGFTLFRRHGEQAWRPIIEGFRPVKAFAWHVVGGYAHAVVEGEELLHWRRWSLESGQSEDLASFPPRIENGGFSVHPDGTSAVVGRLLSMESDLRLSKLPTF